jgi:hypothetical protein
MEDIKSGYDEYVKLKKNEGMPDFMKHMFV